MHGSVSDGFGDGLTAVERIEQLERLNSIRAAEWAHPGAEAEDLAQEAAIAVWGAATGSVGKRDPRAWLSVVAARRIAEAASRQTWTGHTRVHGQPSDPLRQSGKQSLDDPDFTLTESLDGPAWVDGALLAYHHGQIARAISALTPRQRLYVTLRFAHGYGHREITREFGMSDSTWDGAKRVLRERLAHLAAS